MSRSGSGRARSIKEPPPVPSTLSIGPSHKPKSQTGNTLRIWCTQSIHLIIHISIITLVIFSAELIGNAVEKVNGSDKQPLNLWQSIYFTLITISSVGYGDFVCGTNVGKFATAVVIAFTLLNYNIKSHEIERSMKAHEHVDDRVNLLFPSRVEPNLGSQPNPNLITNMRKVNHFLKEHLFAFSLFDLLNLST